MIGRLCRQEHIVDVSGGHAERDEQQPHIAASSIAFLRCDGRDRGHATVDRIVDDRIVVSSQQLSASVGISVVVGRFAVLVLTERRCRGSHSITQPLSMLSTQNALNVHEERRSNLSGSSMSLHASLEVRLVPLAAARRRRDGRHLGDGQCSPRGHRSRGRSSPFSQRDFVVVLAPRSFCLWLSP